MTMWMILVLSFALLTICAQGEIQCYVDFTFSLACNGSDTVNGNLTGLVKLEYRTSGDWDHWVTAGTSSMSSFESTEFALNDSTADLQLRWIQYNASDSPPWFIDEIFVDCSPFSATISFEEIDRTIIDNFWECSSGYVERGNFACIQSATVSHLLMNATEREARTRVFNISSNQPSPSNSTVVSSCRECHSEAVSSLYWPISYVGTQLSFPCNVNSVDITRTCNFDGSVAVWQPSVVDVFNICRTGVPPAGAICAEETTNSLVWSAATIGHNASQFCLQTTMLIRRQCVYDGSSTYWYPDASAVQELCPDGTQRVSERVGMLANQIDEASVDKGIQLIRNFTSERDYTYPKDLMLVADLTASILDRLEGKANKEFSQQFGSIMNELLQPDAVNAINNSPDVNKVEYVGLVLNLTDRFALENHDPKSGVVVTDSLRVTAVEGDTFNQPIEVFSTNDHGSITLNPVVFTSINTTARAGGVLYTNLSNILSRDNRSNYTLVSPVFSVVVNSMSSSQNEMVVEFNLTHQRSPKESEAPACAFYDLSNNSNPFWSTEGCQLIKTTDTYTICGCNHLTHFGVLFDARGTNAKLDSGHRTALQVITYVGVGISLPALLITIICFLVLRSLWSLRTFVNINLCATLFIAQLIFVIGADKTSNNAGCATVAILLHYFFLTSFMWMLMEGIVLYIMLVQVFAQINWRYYIGFALLSYGGPLLYMVLCIPLGLARTDKWSYGNDDVCWLTYDDHFIWAFIVPIIIIIIVNMGFLFMAMRIMYRHRDTAKSKKGSLWYWFKGCFTLIIAMGITWVFGLVALHEYLLPLIYCFAIATSLQGVWIFLLFVVLARPVHEAGKQWWTSTISRSEILSNYYFNKSQAGMKSSRPDSSYVSKKETSQISIDVKSDFTSKETMLKLENYDSSPKVNGRTCSSVSSMDSASFKESSA